VKIEVVEKIATQIWSSVHVIKTRASLRSTLRTKIPPPHFPLHKFKITTNSPRQNISIALVILELIRSVFTTYLESTKSSNTLESIASESAGARSTKGKSYSTISSCERVCEHLALPSSASGTFAATLNLQNTLVVGMILCLRRLVQPFLQTPQLRILC
jgi:hypothetical protein